MKRTWTIIGVADVSQSFKWYQSLLGLPETAPAHDYFGIRDAGKENRAQVAAGVSTPLAAEEPHQVIVHGAVLYAEARGQGLQVEPDTVIAGRVPAIDEEAFVRGDEVGDGRFGQRGGLRLEKSPHRGLSS